MIKCLSPNPITARKSYDFNDCTIDANRRERCQRHEAGDMKKRKNDARMKGMNMNRSLENKVAVVTGGTSGIGKAAALALAEAGAKVVVGGRRESEGQEVVKAIEKAGGKALFVRTDVTRETDVKTLVDKAVNTFGHLDIAFNNAGIEGQ